MTDQTPQTFDLAGFISGATRPRRSVTIYGDGARLAELDRLAEQITAEKHLPAAHIDQRTMADKPLRSQYAELWEQISQNSFEIVVRGHSRDEDREIRGEERQGNLDDLAADALTEELVADALVPSVPVETVRELRAVIGEYQWKKITVAYTKACIGAVGPDADFLPRASTQGGGGTSSRR